jgi:serine/threonine protein kinase
VDSIKNELRAVKKLCKPSGHRNIVAVFNEGQFGDSIFYYIDMELCQTNLEQFIERQREVKRELRTYWEIMKHVLSGLEFIHSQGEAHRDLKPRNGIFYPYMTLSDFKCYSLRGIGPGKSPILA